MALIKCRECGKEISDQATACPNCGCPVIGPYYSHPATPISQNGNYTQPINPQYGSPTNNMPPYQATAPYPIKTKKKHSTLSSIACAFAGVAVIMPIVPILGLLLSFVGMLLGIIDLCLHDKAKKHIGSWFALVVFLIYILILVF